ncbi:hypothetical protein SNEBB_010263 [Seison nebaliae]|nr:hypothetical protein SNEBB_010263 [Seison nebaliae]
MTEEEALCALAIAKERAEDKAWDEEIIRRQAIHDKLDDLNTYTIKLNSATEKLDHLISKYNIYHDECIASLQRKRAECSPKHLREVRPYFAMVEHRNRLKTNISDITRRFIIMENDYLEEEKMLPKKDDKYQREETESLIFDKNFFQQLDLNDCQKKDNEKNNPVAEHWDTYFDQTINNRLSQILIDRNNLRIKHEFYLKRYDRCVYVVNMLENRLRKSIAKTRPVLNEWCRHHTNLAKQRSEIYLLKRELKMYRSKYNSTMNELGLINSIIHTERDLLTRSKEKMTDNNFKLFEEQGEGKEKNDNDDDNDDDKTYKQWMKDEEAELKKEMLDPVTSTTLITKIN